MSSRIKCSTAATDNLFSDENCQFGQCSHTHGGSVIRQGSHRGERVEQGDRFHPNEHNYHNGYGKITMICKATEKENKSQACESNSKILAIKTGSLYSIRVQLYKNDAIVSR